MPSLLLRYAQAAVVDALADTRVVMISGARQTGKSTLAEQIAADGFPSQVTLDDRITRRAAIADPVGFLAELELPALIDEAQRGGPDLLLEIKKIVDRDKRPGRFLLTGSANVFRSRKAYDALTGRIELVRLWPLAQTEIEGSSANFVDSLFSRRPPQIRGAAVGRKAFVERVGLGGYPEARERRPRRREAWFESYLGTTLDRDLRDIAAAYKLNKLPSLLRLLAAQTANELVPANLAKRLRLHPDTVDSYVTLLEAIYLVARIPPWRPGLGARESAKRKAYIVDSGLLLHLLGADERRLAEDDQVTGKALESFAAMEVMKHAEWAETRVRLYHYRRGRHEIDLVMESRGGDLACVEVKAAASARESDWRAMARLRDERGDRFRAGVLLYTGEQTVPLGDRLWAVPISGLWCAG